ncbi:PEPxxWA-CTERM sorting domain-containing protein [Phenylobacterium sp.]|uniref:PEPxxWA-CTERM sorting domain-containing protein n=1 Tax=Phenylobacterium sp. TaxID=1871053 RepID=UPI0025EEFC02|nr:PEPxxWA-CTERM sorting domain-containing protein [Phenylobacterium sp.]
MPAKFLALMGFAAVLAMAQPVAASVYVFDVNVTDRYEQRNCNFEGCATSFGEAVNLQFQVAFTVTPTFSTQTGVDDSGPYLRYRADGVLTADDPTNAIGAAFLGIPEAPVEGVLATYTYFGQFEDFRSDFRARRSLRVRGDDGIDTRYTYGIRLITQFCCGPIIPITSETSLETFLEGQSFPYDFIAARFYANCGNSCPGSDAISYLGTATFNRASSTISPAPEPATWVLLITGFGLMGAVLRRHRAGFVALH